MRAGGDGPGNGQGQPTDPFADGHDATDRDIASPATAALNQVADHWDQLVGTQPVAAGAAVRGRPEQRLAPWQAVQDDLAEAAQGRPQRKQEGRAQEVAQDVKQSVAPPGQHADPHALIIDAYLQVLLEQSASDLILSAGAPPTLRKDGALQPIAREPLRPEQIEEMAREVVSPERWARFQEQGHLDFPFNRKGQARFRNNARSVRMSRLSLTHYGRPSAKRPTSFSSARCGTSRRSRQRSRSPKPVTLSSPPFIPTTPRRPSTGWWTSSPPSSSNRSGCSS